MTQHPVLADDFAVYAQDIAGVARALAIDGYNPHHNRLTVNQSSLETDTTGWVAETNCTIARDLAQAADGVASLRLTSSASGDMNAITTPTNQYTVVPLQQITALASFRAALSARSCRVELAWYDASQVLISSSTGANITDSTSGWTAAFVTATAPTNAAYVRVRVKVLSTAAGAEQHYVDKIALKNTASQTWNIGGSPENGNEKYVTVAALDANGLGVSAGVKLAIDDYLESLRETNFIVEEVDPNYTAIDVQFQAVKSTGYVASDVEATAEAAIADYLNPANWGLPEQAFAPDLSTVIPLWVNKTVVRFYDIVTVLESIPGLDHLVPGTVSMRVAGGTYATTDITLGGPAPLPTAGTITGTVT
jgi:hypothetical protein